MCCISNLASSSLVLEPLTEIADKAEDCELTGKFQDCCPLHLFKGRVVKTM